MSTKRYPTVILEEGRWVVGCLSSKGKFLRGSSWLDASEYTEAQALAYAEAAFEALRGYRPDFDRDIIREAFPDADRRREAAIKRLPS